MANSVLFEWVRQDPIVKTGTHIAHIGNVGIPLTISANDKIPNPLFIPGFVDNIENKSFISYLMGDADSVLSSPVTVPCFTMTKRNMHNFHIQLDQAVGGDVVTATDPISFDILIELSDGTLVKTSQSIAQGSDSSLSGSAAYRIIAIVTTSVGSNDMNKTVSVVTDMTGSTFPFLCDVWNKESLYSFGVIRMEYVPNSDAPPVNTKILDVVPEIAINQVPYFSEDRNKPTYAPEWFDIEGVDAFNSIGIQNFPNFPVSAFRFLVDVNNTAEFDAIILQQGGKV